MFQLSAHCPPEARLLSTFFDPSQPHESFTDTEIEDVQLLLQRCPHYGYASDAPRTFIVLCHIGHLQVLRQLLAEDFGDSWFPLGKRSLPSFLNARIRAAIVEHQHIIFTKSIDLEKGIHCYLGAHEERPFDIVSHIACGSFGKVSCIQSKVTYRYYALKTIRRELAYGRRSRDVMRKFITEMKIMKRLRHQHIVQYIGSYTDNKDLGIVMSPIADCDLAKYLDTYCTQPEYYPTIRTFYGCLASALVYLHNHHIKHRDIKPGNILVYKASVLLTDFGLSHESLDTSSGTSPGTSRYQSPEVAALDKRNETTDVWSLGCVFLEMLAALNGCNGEWLKTYYAGTGTGSTLFHANSLATQFLLSHWHNVTRQEHAKPIFWIETMLVADRRARPTAAQVAAKITTWEDSTFTMYSCHACADYNSDSDSLSTTNDSSMVAATASKTRSRPRASRKADTSSRVNLSTGALSVVTKHTGYSIEHVKFLCGTSSYTFCRPVPIIFGKCIEHILMIEGRQFQGSLISQPYAGSRYKVDCVRLKREFESSSEYAKRINLHRYNIFDCVSVLLDYIATIPELFGREWPKTDPHGPRLRSEKAFAVILATLPERNFELILVIIAFFAAYAELGGAHATSQPTACLNYRGWIQRVAKLFHAIVVRPLELGDKSSIQTLKLVLSTPTRFRSIAMAERSKRARARNQTPPQPLFRKQVGASPDDQPGRFKSKSESWSNRATYGGDSDQNNDLSDGEAWSSEDIGVDDYDSDKLDAIDLERMPPQVNDVDGTRSFQLQNDIDQSRDRQISRIRPNTSQHSRLHECRSVQRRDAAVETLALTVQPATTTQCLTQQEPLNLHDVPEMGDPFKPELWGLSVGEAVEVAGHNIRSMPFLIYGKQVTFTGRVPIVVAKCIEKVMCSDSEAETTAMYCLLSGHYQSSPEHFAQLKELFSASASYGAKIDWNKYKATDAIDVLFDYLKSLREPLMPSDLSCKLPSLYSYVRKDYVPSDLDFLHLYGICLAKMPESSRQLLLILIAFLASQVGCTKKMLENDGHGLYNEAASRWSFFLSHPLEHRSATFTLFIVNAEYFLSRANGLPPTPAIWSLHIQARRALVEEKEKRIMLQNVVKSKNVEPAAESMQDAIGMTASINLEQKLEQQDEDRKIKRKISLHDIQQYICDNHRSIAHGRKHMHHPNVKDATSELDSRNETLTTNINGSAPYRHSNRVEPAMTERRTDPKLTKLTTTGPAATSEETISKTYHLGKPSVDLRTTQSPLLKPNVKPKSRSVVGSLIDAEAQELPHGDRHRITQGILGVKGNAQPALHRANSPHEPTITVRPNGNDCREGVSSPPTPKRGMTIPNANLPRLDITPTNDADMMESPHEDSMQQERLTPVEPPIKPSHANDSKAAESPVVWKKRHRRSGGSWTSQKNEKRARGAAGEPFKTDKRRSRDNEEIQIAAQSEQDKKQHWGLRESLYKPEKGFRDWFHGYGKKK